MLELDLKVEVNFIDVDAYNEDEGGVKEIAAASRILNTGVNLGGIEISGRIGAGLGHCSIAGGKNAQKPGADPACR